MKFLNVRYFDSSEFDSPDSPGSGIKMDLAFLQKLDQLRDECNFPFHITSGYRTKEHNTKINGELHSAHLEGRAADVSIIDGLSRFKFISTAIKLGFTRIGISDNFIHVDNSTILDQNVVWLYPSGTKY